MNSIANPSTIMNKFTREKSSINLGVNIGVAEIRKNKLIDENVANTYANGLLWYFETTVTIIINKYNKRVNAPTCDIFPREKEVYKNIENIAMMIKSSARLTICMPPVILDKYVFTQIPSITIIFSGVKF